MADARPDPLLKPTDAPDTARLTSEPADTPARPGAAAQLSRNLSLALLLGLIALGLGWELWWAPTGSGTLAVKVLPLLPAVPGIIRYRLYTFRWLSLLVWLYAFEGLVRASSETGLGRGLAITEVSLSVALFATCAWHVRARLADGKSGLARQVAPTEPGRTVAESHQAPTPAP